MPVNRIGPYLMMLVIVAILFNACGSSAEKDGTRSVALCNSPVKISTILKEDVYDLSGYEGPGGGNAYFLFDENALVDPVSKFGNPTTNPHPVISPANYFPDGKGSRIVTDLQVTHFLSEIYLFDRSVTPDTVWVYTGNMKNWKQVAVIQTSGNSSGWGWKKIPVNDSSRFVMIRFKTWKADITEMVLYGCPLYGLPHRNKNVMDTDSAFTLKPMKKFLGVNMYEPMPLKWLDPFHYIRMYTFTSVIDSDTSRKYPENLYNPFFFGSYDNEKKRYSFFADSIVKQGKKIWYTIMGVPRWFEKKGYGNHDRPVNIPGMDTEDPDSYTRHAGMMWNLSAAFGSTITDTHLMNTLTPRFSGRDFLNEYENGNEPDAFWVGNRYSNPVEYFYQSSADFDGHEGRIGNRMGINRADTLSRLMMAGFTSLDTNRLRVLHFLSRNIRTDKRFIWQGGIQYHHYSHNGKGNTVVTRWNSATAGISPEQDSLRVKLAKVSRFTAAIQPETECILGEFGYDKSRKSKVSAPLLKGYSQSESQAILLLRAINAVAFSGFDRMILYWMKDRVDEDDDGLYLTSGLVKEDSSGRIIPYPAWFYIKTFIDAAGNYIPDSIITEKDKVWVYRYRDSSNPNRNLYFVYCASAEGAIVRNYKLKIDKPDSGKAISIRFDPGSEKGRKEELMIHHNTIQLDVSESPVLILIE